MAEPSLPGYDVVELLGFGSGGEVWLAREHSTGEPVALKRLREGADLTARDRLRREAAVLAGVEHPHVLRLRSVVGSGDTLVLVLDLATGGSLARLLATRQRLEPGEVVTLAVPLAQALAAAHAVGVVHGDVTPANVLFAADGRPVLSDLGVARLIGSPAAQRAGTSGFRDPAALGGLDAGPASDVHGLAATCFAALTGHPPYDDLGARRSAAAGHGPLLAVLERALAPEPADRPGAAELAALAFAATAARPVRLASGDPVARPAEPPPVGQLITHVVAADESLSRAAFPIEAEPPGARPVLPGARARALGAGARRRVAARWRPAAGVLLAAVAVTMAAVTGMAWASAGDDPVAGGVGVDRSADRSGAPSRSVAKAATPDWAATMSALDARRSSAFATGDPAALARVYAPAAPALRRDGALLDRLVEAGLRARGLRLRAVEINEVSRAARRVVLRVEDVMPPYRLVDGSGAVVERRAGRERARWIVTLVRVGERWRVYDVTRG